MKKQIGINKGFATILFENKVFDEKILPKFIKSVDCLVSPTMGEGFNLPGLQCMSLGVPVIITNFSGCTDYANEKTATLLEPNGFILRNNMDNIPQFKNRKWAFLEVKKIQESMRYVFKNQNQAKIKANSAYSFVRDKFNYKIVGDMFVDTMRDLYG
jgi:glycosyltransferase involved in cell wall biosynthesis